MKLFARLALLGVICLVVAVAVVSQFAGSGWWRGFMPLGQRTAPAHGDQNTDFEACPDPNAPGTSKRVSLGGVPFDYDIFGVMLPYAGTIRDTNSLQELREAIRGRGRRALADLQAQYDHLGLSSSPTFDQALQAMRLARLIAFACMFDGKFAEASSWLQRALEFSQTRGMPPDLPRVFYVLLGLAALRQGEIENCLECMGPSSCIFPLEPGAVHRQQAGSREAVKQFMAYLEDAPDDLRARWLLNIAYMTLGEYPQRFGVPSEQWIKEVGDGLRRRTLA